ncbi:MAG: hypothetical protein ABIK44_07245 [candidate division WOR-3 bacterium]
MTRYSRSFLSIILGLCSVLFADWVTTGTDTLTENLLTRKFVAMQSLAVDSLGTLHAAWIEQVGTGPKTIYYARKPQDSVWSRPEPVAETTANHLSLAVEPRTGKVHIAYQYQWNTVEDLCYATNRTGHWQRYRLTQDTILDHNPTLALEESLAHIAWITLDAGGAYRIGYITNRTGHWQRQILAASQLGGFGLGAAPWLSLEPNGTAHVTYRGGDYPDYHVHHAQNRSAGDTIWFYEVLVTGNPYDYTSASVAKDSGELFVVVSGDEGWGMPCHIYYLHRPPNSSQWDPCQLMTASASASLRGFAMDRRAIHASWEQINGNIATERLYHVTNTTGYWFNSPLRADGRTRGGALAVGPDHCGHCLVVVRAGSDTTWIGCVHSAPFTAVTEERESHWFSSSARIIRPPCRIGLTGTTPAVIYSVSGRHLATLAPSGRELLWDGKDLSGQPVPTGTYILRQGGSAEAIMLVR